MPNESSNQHSIHTFSAREASYQDAFSNFRQRLFMPLLIVLEKTKVSPDTLSLCSMLVMLLLPLGFLYSPLYLLLAYVLSLFFDGIDGALARHIGKTSARGAYLDVVADHVSLFVTVLTLQWFGIGQSFWVLLYTVCYLVLIIHFVLMNTRGSPPTFPVVRTKYPLFLLVILMGYGFVGSVWLDYFFLILGVYYAMMVLVYIALFRWSLPS